MFGQGPVVDVLSWLHIILWGNRKTLHKHISIVYLHMFSIEIAEKAFPICMQSQFCPFLYLKHLKCSPLVY